MRTLAIALAAALVGVSSAGAQTRGAPNLIFSIYGGASNGQELWSIDRQPMPDRGGPAPDTVRLARRLDNAIIVGLLTSLFPSPHVGANIEIGFRTFGFDDQCVPATSFRSDDPPRNQVLCDNITASARSGSALTVNVGATGRLAPHGTMSPYVRGAVSISHTTISTISVIEAEPLAVGGFADRALVANDNPPQLAVGVMFGAGLTVRAGAGYQFRLEVRDDVSRHTRLVGPADAAGMAPTSVTAFHNWGLLLGIDIVLEQKRTRRY